MADRRERTEPCCGKDVPLPPRVGGPVQRRLFGSAPRLVLAVGNALSSRVSECNGGANSGVVVMPVQPARRQTGHW